MDRVLGLDGGGTKTDAAVIDRAGTVIARQRTEGLDPTESPHWKVVLGDIAEKMGAVATAVLGLPYHGEIAQISADQTAVAGALFGAGTIVTNDVAVAFEGALGGMDGVLVLAGTGSMAWSRGPLGVHRVGGWGPVFGDEGSAYWIGRAALGQISQQLDGRRVETRFAHEMLQDIGVARDGLIGWASDLGHQRARIAAVAVAVSRLAQLGNREAVTLMAEAAHHLGNLGQSARRLSGAPERWSYAGGVMTDQAVLAALTDRMGCAPTPPLMPPVGGALVLAAKAAGWDTGPDFMHRLQAGLAQ